MCAMTTTNDATAAILQQAQEIHAARMAALEPLAETLAEVKVLQEQLAALEEKYRQHYAAAEKAGWSEDELTLMEAPAPTRRLRGRPAKRATPAKRTITAAAATGGGDRDKVPGQSTPPSTESPAGSPASASA